MTIKGKYAWALCGLVILSLAANAFFIGQKIGHEGKRKDRGNISRILPPDTAPELRSRVAQHRDALRPRVDALRAHRKELRLLMQQEPLPVAEITAAFAHLRAETSALQEDTQLLILEIAADLTPEQRAAWLPRFDRPLRSAR